MLLERLYKLSNKSLMGKIIRIPLKLVSKSRVFKILNGPNKGFKWIVGSGIHSCWIGNYEFSKQKKVILYGSNCKIFYDIGAHAGFYTMMFSKLANKNGAVYAFEPNPYNLYNLNKHLDINSLYNVSVFQTAVSDFKDYISFVNDENSYMGKINQSGSGFYVNTDYIDNLVTKNIIKPPDFIKIDVEGAELSVLKGSMNTLQKYYPILFIAIDDKENKVEIYHLLTKLEYNISTIDNNDFEIIAISNKNYLEENHTNNSI